MADATTTRLHSIKAQIIFSACDVIISGASNKWFYQFLEISVGGLYSFGETIVSKYVG